MSLKVAFLSLNVRLCLIWMRDQVNMTNKDSDVRIPLSEALPLSQRDSTLKFFNSQKTEWGCLNGSKIHSKTPKAI